MIHHYLLQGLRSYIETFLPLCETTFTCAEVIVENIEMAGETPAMAYGSVRWLAKHRPWRMECEMVSETPVMPWVLLKQHTPVQKLQGYVV